jgi:hypothetical protein
MPGNSREMITTAERRFPVRIRIAVPPRGLGQRHPQITAWLDENCGADGWAITPSGTRGVLNDALSIYFADATLASAFVAGGALSPNRRLPGAYFRCARMNRRDGSALGRIRHLEGGEMMSAIRTRDHRWTVMGSAWKPAGDPKCAFSDGYWQGRLLEPPR